VVLAGVGGGGVFGALDTGGLESPDAESYRAAELLKDHFGHRPARAATTSAAWNALSPRPGR
jgi:RND superfamily putative drug exporter